MTWQDLPTDNKDPFIPFDDVLDEDDFDMPPDLLIELHMEEVTAGIENSKNSKKEKVFTDIIKQPVEGEVRLDGRMVFRGNIKCGCLNYLLHWQPAAMAANCMLHSDCYITSPLVDDNGNGPSEDDLVRWLGEAPCYRTGADHLALRPAGSYEKRRRKT